MVAKYRSLITCSLSLVLCFVRMIIFNVLYATKCLIKETLLQTFINEQINNAKTAKWRF